MGLREELQADLADAFSRDDELGQAYSNFTATREMAGDYVPGSGSSDVDVLNYSGSYWRSEFTFAELQALQIEQQDIKIGMLADQVDLIPKVDDRLILEDRQIATVLTVTPDPVGATYSLHLRGTGQYIEVNGYKLADGADYMLSDGQVYEVAQ